MGFTKRLITALTVLVVLAAACSDDGGVDADAVNAALDDLASDSTDTSDDPPAETEDPPAETEDPPAETEDPPAETEDPGLEVVSACVVLRHYSSEMWPGFPYHASIVVNTTTQGGGIIVTHNVENEALFTSGSDGAGAGFDVNWPVSAPGQVDLPSSIEVDGVEMIDTLVNDHFGSQNSFVAAASDFTDEWELPDPGPFDVPIPDGNTIG